jgi:hypothetical protein
MGPIQEFRDLGIEGILSLLIGCFYPLIPQFLNIVQIYRDNVPKS